MRPSTARPAAAIRRAAVSHSLQPSARAGVAGPVPPAVAVVLAVLEDRAAAADNDLTRQKSDAALSEKGGVFCFSMQVYLRRDKYRGLVDKYHPYVTIARNTEKAVREKSKQVTYQPAIWGKVEAQEIVPAERAPEQRPKKVDGSPPTSRSAGSSPLTDLRASFSAHG